MQIQVKSVRCLKKGTNEYGPWALYKIVGSDDKIYTTLADGAEGICQGSVIGPDAVMLGEVKAGVQEYKFKKFEFVDGGASGPPADAPPPPAGNGEEMTKQEWAEKDRIHRESMERMSAWHGLTEVASAVVAAGGDPTKQSSVCSAEFSSTYKAALTWARGYFGDDPDWEAIKRQETGTRSAQAAKAGPPAPDTASGNGDLSNIGSVLKKSYDTYGLQREDTLAIAGVQAALNDGRYTVAWEMIEAHMNKR